MDETPPMYGSAHQASSEYGVNPPMTSENMVMASDYDALTTFSSAAGSFRDPHRRHHHNRLPVFGSDELSYVASAISAAAASSVAPGLRRVRGREDDVASSIKAKIASHPRYPRLVQAYIDCQKVGAPPDVETLLDKIQQQLREQSFFGHDVFSVPLGADTELDEFMDKYCEILVKYKSDLSRPFDEATSFLHKTQLQLNNLCGGASTSTATASEEAAFSSDEECSGGETAISELQIMGEDRDLKDTLLRRFGSHLGSLKLEFSKKKNKGKLPREARQTLLDWWIVHYKWPYPTEADKVALAESTGLDQRQINNWFINQRKRHWKPTENMQFALMGSLSGQYLTDDR